MAIDLGTDGYCELEDVQSLHQQRTFAASGSKPTESEVEAWITRGFHLVNGTLTAIGYSTPVDVDNAPQSKEILREINLNYAAARVELAVYSAGLGGVPEVAKELMVEFRNALKDLRGGMLSLPDATT